MAYVSCVDPAQAPTSVKAAAPAHEGMVAYIEDLRKMCPGASTSMLLTRFGPYSKVEQVGGRAVE